MMPISQSSGYCPLQARYPTRRYLIQKPEVVGANSNWRKLGGKARPTEAAPSRIGLTSITEEWLFAKGRSHLVHRLIRQNCAEHRC